MRYTIVGAAGYIAERHVKAIKYLGGEVVAVCDTHSCVGYIDRYFPNCQFFNNYSQCLEEVLVDYVVVCTPNHLHYTHTTQALLWGYNVICEKPLVTSVKQLDLLAEYQRNNTINTILQLRYHQEILELKEKLSTASNSVEIRVDYLAPRGDWYDKSWKGDRSKSGGLLFNIGVHLFDMLCWILGDPLELSITKMDKKLAEGRLVYSNATVSWRLSTTSDQMATKKITVNNKAFSFANNFEKLHLKSHAEILAGRGFGIDDARPSTLLIESLYKQWSNERRSEQWSNLLN